MTYYPGFADEARPPVRPAEHLPGYTAGWWNWGATRAWGLTPTAAVRRWRRKMRREEKKEARAAAVSR